MKLQKLLSIILFLSGYSLYAQDTAQVKALFIDHFFEADSSIIILGDSVAEQELFDYTQNCGYNYLILYGLSAVPLGNHPEAVDALRSFVKRAHRDYGLKLGCIGQSSRFFERIHNKYQSLSSVSSDERLDSYQLEFEFWKSYHSGVYTGYYCDNYLEPNAYSCDSIGAFEFAMDELDKIDSIGNLLSDTLLFSQPTNVSTDIYIGWINEKHAEVLLDKIAQNKLDRILGATYKPALEDGSLNLYHFFHQEERLQFLGGQETQFDYIPIFAVQEKQGNHLGDWMDSIGSIPLVWEHFSGEFNTDTSYYTQYIHLKGYAWYHYSAMPLCFDSLGSSGIMEGPDGELFKDSIYTFSLNETENATRFYWELPKGVYHADSLKWNNTALLGFTSEFEEGDSIVVRAANRCHIGEKQYFIVNSFDFLTAQTSEKWQIHFTDHHINIRFNSIPDKTTHYSIYQLNGTLLQEGTIQLYQKTTRIPFETGNTGWYVLRLYNEKDSTVQMFFAN